MLFLNDDDDEDEDLIDDGTEGTPERANEDDDLEYKKMIGRAAAKAMKSHALKRAVKEK